MRHLNDGAVRTMRRYQFPWAGKQFGSMTAAQQISYASGTGAEQYAQLIQGNSLRPLVMESTLAGVHLVQRPGCNRFVVCSRVTPWMQVHAWLAGTACIGTGHS